MILVYTALGLLVAALIAWTVYTYVLHSPSKAAPGPALSQTDCQYGAWSPWIGCDAGTPAECGDGVAVSIRGIVQEAVAGGAQCDESAMVQTMLCSVLNAASCSNAACSYTSWSAWSACPSVTCESSSGVSCTPQAVSVRTRGIAHEAAPGAPPCDPMQLFEYAPCQSGAVCPPPVDCVPADWAAAVWSGCPTETCVLPGQPAATVWEYQYRGVSVSAANGGADCAYADFVRSQTCALPPCTSCTVLSWGAWSSCDVPCTTPQHAGTIWQQADAIATGSYFFCNSTSVSTCTSTAACPAGAFGPPLAGSWSAAIMQTFAAPNSVTLYDLLALCAGEAGCAGVNWNTGAALGGGWGYGNLLSSVDTLTANPNFELYAWDPASTNCVPPSWPMLQAECLDLCSDPGAALPARGRVYPFAGQVMPDGVTPALSCPVTLDLLEAAGACAPDAATGSFSSLSCAGSEDCVYQAWVDAGPWSACDSACGYANGGGGTRQRTRNIVTPPSFMGAPCDPDQLTQYTACNSPTTVTSAPGMVCIPRGGIAAPVASAAACAAASVASASTGYSYAGADTLAAAQAAGQQIFYASWNQTYTPRAQTDALIASASAAGFSDWRYAGLDELLVAQAAGAQWCATGFTAGSSGAAYYPMQDANVAGCGAPGVDMYLPGGAGGVFVGTKPSAAAAAQLAAATSIVVLPFVTSYSGGSLPQTWDMPTLVGGACMLPPAPWSIDAMLSIGGCAPAASSLSLAADAPCLASTPCSLSAWQDISSCPTCGEPTYQWQVRDIVAPPTNGGTPCSAFVMRQSVSCNPPPPPCAALQGASVYGPWPSTQAPGPAPCQAVPAGFAFKESWDAPVQAAWIQAGAYDALNMYAGGMPQDLADALNAQCLATGGAPPLCVATSGGTYSMSSTLGTDNNVTYTGWAVATCTPDAGMTACLASRPACPYLSYSPAGGTCFCPSTCPYVPASCAWQPCTAVCQGAAGVETMYRSLVQGGADFNPAELVWDTACAGGSDMPACAKPCQPSPDGSPCAAASGHGYCDTTSGACVCSASYEAGSCWYGCPTAGNGVVCAGQGTCMDGTCVCNAGYTGAACEFPPYSLLFDALVVSYLAICDENPTSGICTNADSDIYNIGYQGGLKPDLCVPLAYAMRNGGGGSMDGGPWLPARYGFQSTTQTCDALGYTTYVPTVASTLQPGTTIPFAAYSK